ncbi:hypothetical protein KX935_07760 [Streptobacillus moniliformis]|uniref:hypothetical protein n=1 Tax=Streptobacillus moniliformis TaxID=34105 RepID=UPI0007E31F9A|nr:hypothetical protein [Streptobacillus moniliformis]QXW65640.1 hypothetical protein KX935_07760 [Streptobacillus moniliformis]
MAIKFLKVSGKMYKAILSNEVNYNTVKIYLYMVERANITRLKDKNGNKYFLMTREELSGVLKTTFLKDITNAIKELEKQEVIKVIREKGKPNKYYWLDN